YWCDALQHQKSPKILHLLTKKLHFLKNLLRFPMHHLFKVIQNNTRASKDFSLGKHWYNVNNSRLK
ncbi:hypothetical protein, partial [Salmonella enterica]|uniref:hypothetical protein n=1 Tax=Salmonella enterica TaxID=28901 RepID=UPI0032990A52